MTLQRSKKAERNWEVNGTNQLLVYADDVNVMGRIMNTIKNF
jgi:hypothetical protein